MMNNKIAIVVSQFNKEISNNLINGALNCYKKNGGDPELVSIFKVPGAFEIPGTVRQILNRNNDYEFKCIICYGSVIKGETAHFEYICNSVTNAIMDMNIENNNLKVGVPILYGILTTYTYEQALERSKTTSKDKGGEVMSAALLAIESYTKINN